METDFICKFRKLDERGKTSVTCILDQEYSYIEALEREAYMVERSDYIKKHALPFAAAGGDSSNLDEAQGLYDRAKGGRHNE